MGWFLLVLAGLFEVGWAIGLKYTDGLTRPLPALSFDLSPALWHDRPRTACREPVTRKGEPS